MMTIVKKYLRSKTKLSGNILYLDNYIYERKKTVYCTLCVLKHIWREEMLNRHTVLAYVDS